MIVAYYRVSTRKQSESGLGLDAQREAVRKYAASVSDSIIAEFTEVESGRNKSRPKLREAAGLANSTGATLVVARIDRLARNVAFLSALMETGVKFVACDNPHANSFVVHVMAAMAQFESELISARTKAAHAQYKARGGLLGSHHPSAKKFTKEHARLGNLANAKLARERALAYQAGIRPLIQSLRDAGKSWLECAVALNERGIRTRHGKRWEGPTVRATFLGTNLRKR